MGCRALLLSSCLMCGGLHIGATLAFDSCGLRRRSYARCCGRAKRRGEGLTARRTMCCNARLMILARGV